MWNDFKLRKLRSSILSSFDVAISRFTIVACATQTCTKTVGHSLGIQFDMKKVVDRFRSTLYIASYYFKLVDVRTGVSFS